MGSIALDGIDWIDVWQFGTVDLRMQSIQNGRTRLQSSQNRQTQLIDLTRMNEIELKTETKWTTEVLAANIIAEKIRGIAI